MIFSENRLPAFPDHALTARLPQIGNLAKEFLK
jgi:hypothetical protein